mgnify:CR=1 FL=1
MLGTSVSYVIGNKINSILDDEKNTISKYISKNSIIKSKSRSEAILVYGIDPNSTNLGIEDMITEGSFELEKIDGPPGIVIGKKLSEKLQA